MDKQTFVSAAQAMEGAMYRIARSYLRSDADCADATQQALMKAWARRDTLREEGYFRTWMIRILINACKDMLRAAKRVVPMESPPEPPSTCERYGEDDEARALLAALMPEMRVTVSLYYLDGYSVAEIARLLRIPAGTVKNRLFRARRLLRIEWDKNEKEAFR